MDMKIKYFGVMFHFIGDVVFNCACPWVLQRLLNLLTRTHWIFFGKELRRYDYGYTVQLCLYFAVIYYWFKSDVYIVSWNTLYKK